MANNNFEKAGVLLSLLFGPSVQERQGQTGESLAEEHLYGPKVGALHRIWTG